ncbi:hypothetical protein GGI43DRAFT_323781 [Trichoderma evansii]
MGARDLSGYPRNLVNRRRSGFACQKWSGEGAWVAFLRGVCRFWRGSRALAGCCISEDFFPSFISGFASLRNGVTRRCSKRSAALAR